jgi:hypothetical protein
LIVLTIQENLNKKLEMVRKWKKWKLEHYKKMKN